MKNEILGNPTSVRPTRSASNPILTELGVRVVREDLLHYWTAPDSQILKNIHDQLPNTVDSIIRTGNYELREKFFLGVAFLLPTQTPQLQPTWEMLSEYLNKEKVMSDNHEPTVIRAFFIASALLAQTKLPVLEKKLSVRNAIGRDAYSRSQNAVARINLLNQTIRPKEEDQDPSSPTLLDLERTLSQFRSLYEEIAAVPVQDANMLLRNLHLIDALLSQTKLPLYEIFIDGMGKKGHNWIYKIVNEGARKIIAGNEEITADLLFTGKLDKMDLFIKSLVCFGILGSDLPKEKAVEYFLEHPEIQEIFWQDFPSKGWGGTDTKNLFLQEEEILGKILDTIPREKLYPQGSKRKEFLLKFIGTAAMLKDNHPDHPNTPYLLRYIRGMNEAEKDDDLTILLNILDDRTPGFIYLGQDGRILFKTPRKHQRIDTFLGEVTWVVNNSKGVLYLPPAGVEQEEKLVPVNQNGHRKEEALPKEYPPREHPLDSVTGETKLIPLWGEVMIPKPADRQLIWDLLNQRLAQTHRNLTPQKALSILTAENTVTRHGNDAFLIIPELLPISTPVGMLKDLGIISIEQRENQVTIIIDGKRISDNAKSLRFMLNTQLDETNDATPLALLLKTASLLGRRSFTEQTLSKEEISEIRSRRKTWNLKAKTEHLPQVIFDEDPTARMNGTRVLTFIGKKPVILSIVS